MVEQSASLDKIFSALADPTRRDILARLQLGELNVSEAASIYDVSLAATSKHLKILEQAGLVHKHKRGKERVVTLAHGAMQQAREYLRQYGVE